jgi:hypothetical protein
MGEILQVNHPTFRPGFIAKTFVTASKPDAELVQELQQEDVSSSDGPDEAAAGREAREIYDELLCGTETDFRKTGFVGLGLKRRPSQTPAHQDAGQSLGFVGDAGPLRENWHIAAQQAASGMFTRTRGRRRPAAFSAPVPSLPSAPQLPTVYYPAPARVDPLERRPPPRAMPSSAQVHAASADSATITAPAVVDARPKRVRFGDVETAEATVAGPAASSEEYVCEVCGVAVAGAAQAAHIRSTLHQFKLQEHLSPAPVFFVPPDSVGYRLMTGRMGWTGAGLGPREQGPTEPVATRVKNDRLGVGAPTRNVLAVTHSTAQRGTHGRSTHVVDFEAPVRGRRKPAVTARRELARRVSRERRRHHAIHDAVYKE